MQPEMPNDAASRVRYVLDTDTVTYQQLGRTAVRRRLAQSSPDEVATTVVTMYEQPRGRMAAVSRNQDDEALRVAYERLHRTQMYYCRMRVLPFDPAAVVRYRELVNRRLRIGAQDLKIAAIALAHDAILVSSNRRHFDRVPGLRIEDWNLDR